MTYGTEPLSPELALVDPELGERARRALRAAASKDEPPRIEGPAFRTDEAAPLAPAPTDSPPSPATPPRRVRLVRVAAALAVPSIALNVALLRDTTDRDGRAAVTVTASADRGVGAARFSMRSPPVPASSPTAGDRRRAPVPLPRTPAPRTPAAPRIARTPTTLRWAKQRRAQLYDVVVWRNGRRVKDVWTREPGVPVQTLACNGPVARLGLGRYLWFVYPVYAPSESKRHGRLLGWGTFAVTRETCAPRRRGRTS